MRIRGGCLVGLGLAMIAAGVAGFASRGGRSVVLPPAAQQQLTLPLRCREARKRIDRLRTRFELALQTDVQRAAEARVSAVDALAVPASLNGCRQEYEGILRSADAALAQMTRWLEHGRGTPMRDPLQALRHAYQYLARPTESIRFDAYGRPRGLSVAQTPPFATVRPRREIRLTPRGELWDALRAAEKAFVTECRAIEAVIEEAVEDDAAAGAPSTWTSPPVR